MCRIAGAQNLLQRLTVAFLGFAIVMSASVMAVEGEVVRTVPQGIRWVNAVPGGASTSASVMTDIGGQRAMTKIPVTVGSATLGMLAKGLLKRVSGPVAVLQTVIDLANWHLDQQTKDILDSPNVPETQQPAGTPMWCITDTAGQLRCTSYATPENLIPIVNARVAPATVTTHALDSESFYRYRLSNGGSFLAARNVVQTWTPDYGTGHSGQPISDQALGDFLRTHPEAVNAVLIDPDTGAPIMTPELAAALNNLRKQLEAANSIPPGPDVTAPGTYPPNPTPSETMWPGFCDWATTVCEFIEWVKAPEEPTEPPEVPFEETPIQMQQWSAGLGGGACPAPIAFSVSLGGTTQNLEFEYDPICSFAATMRPLVYTIALVLVPFIVGGFRSSKDA